MAKRWDYSDASICQVGTMICTACREKILDGAFRYRETDDGFMPQHKACCSEDPEWARILERQQKAANYFVRRLKTLAAYCKEFGAPDDDLIDQAMQLNLHEDQHTGDSKSGI